jgi:hypothetical protein
VHVQLTPVPLGQPGEGVRTHPDFLSPRHASSSI